MRWCLGRRVIVFATLLLCISAGLQAQTMGTGTTPSVGFAPTPVNAQATTNGTVFATINFATGGELGSWDFVVQGIPTTEFYDYGNGNCAQNTTYSAGASCTVSVAFLPTLSGGKKGALRFKDQNGNVFGWVYLYGIGSAPVASVMYGGETAYVENSLGAISGQPVSNPTLGRGVPVFGIDVDNNGDVMIPDGAQYDFLIYGGGTDYARFNGPTVGTSGDPIVGVARDGLGAVFMQTAPAFFVTHLQTLSYPAMHTRR